MLTEYRCVTDGQMDKHLAMTESSLYIAASHSKTMITNTLF